MVRFWTETVKRYYIAVIIASLLMDVVVEPFFDFHHYTDIWQVTGVTVQGDPLFVLLQYPLTALIWVGVPRLVQIYADVNWRSAFYTGFVLLAIVEEVINEYIIQFWTYTENIAWTNNFWINLPIIIVLGWLTWAVLADLIATGYSESRRKHRTIQIS